MTVAIDPQHSEMKRRDFLKASVALGGGLIIGAYIPQWNKTSAATLVDAMHPFAPNAFVRIGTDDSITVIANHSEMGQGVYTSLPMMLAEDLDCDWSKGTARGLGNCIPARQKTAGA